MRLIDPVAQEFEIESASTRKLLAVVPFDKLTWRPHPKSTTLGDLASHIVTLTGWGLTTFTTTELSFESKSYQPARYPTPEALLAGFDQNVRCAMKALAEVRDEDMGVPWTLNVDGRNVLTLPRAAVMRTLVLNHIIHHRGQLSVYLRLLDVPLPSIYGPSADTPV